MDHEPFEVSEARIKFGDSSWEGFTPMEYLFWLSFCDSKLNKWLGGCFVLCDTPEHAIEKTWKLNINPGGEVLVALGLEFCDEVLETFNEKGSKLDYLYETREEIPGGYERMPE